MKNLFIILLLSFTTSCLALTDPLFADIPTSNNFVNRFKENKKGIVLLKLNSDYISTSWCQANFEIELKNKNCIKINPTNYYQIIMLEPGWYEIDGYKTVTRRLQTVRETQIEPNISNITGKRKTLPQVAFEVKEGKISYVGNIKFHHISVSGTQIKGDDFVDIENIFKNQDQKQLLKFFKGHRFEAKIIAEKIAQDPQLLIKNLAKTKADFTEEKQIIKKEERETKKAEMKYLRDQAKKARLQKSLQKFGNSRDVRNRKLRDYQN